MHIQKPVHEMFAAALFTATQNWKSPRCSTVGASIVTVVHSDNGVCLSATKKLALKL
jgi:hypothetical protein